MLKTGAKVGSCAIPIVGTVVIAKTVIPNFSKPIVYKVLNFFVQHFPKFVYLCPHQPKKNIPTQKITDYITY